MPLEFGPSGWAYERRAIGAVVEPVFLLPAAEPGVRVVTSSTTRAGTSRGTGASSVKAAPKRAAADPSAMHHGHKQLTSSSTAYTGPV